LNSGFGACKAGALVLELHLWSIFALVILEMGSICPGWLRSSQVARITGVSHPAPS
jgi:hypothetical protein